MEHSDQMLIDIADKMLMKLELEYLQVHKYDAKKDVQCPENSQENQHEGYQIIDGDQQDQFNQSSDSSEQKQQKNEDEQQQNRDKNDSQPTISESKSEDIAEKVEKIIIEEGVKVEQTGHKEQQNAMQLMQVFPYEQWKPQQKQININADKIKQCTLKMNLPLPDWMKNEAMLRDRITQLFGKQK